MRFKKLGNKFFVRLDRGEEICETLKKFCGQQKIKAGSVRGIGAVNKIVLGLFDPQTKKYHSQEFAGNYEITPLEGNVSTLKNEVYLHLHINLSDKKHRSFGGHLNSAMVSATAEIIIEKASGKIERGFSPEIGLNLWKP